MTVPANFGTEYRIQYHTLMIDPRRSLQFHTLPCVLHSWAALPNSYPNALRAIQGGGFYHFYVWSCGMTRLGVNPRPSHERGTRSPLNPHNTVH